MASRGREKERNAFLIDGLKSERMKTHSVVISPGVDNRVKAIYEAPADTLDGQECVKTVYVYVGTSTSPMFSKEVPALWEEQFEDDAITKATADGYSAQEISELETK